MIIDIISCIINSAVVTWLYCVLFRYNVNNFSLTNKENKQQIICLGLSLFVAWLLKRKNMSLSIAASELEKLIQKDNGVNNREQVKR